MKKIFERIGGRSRSSSSSDVSNTVDASNKLLGLNGLLALESKVEKLSAEHVALTQNTSQDPAIDLRRTAIVRDMMNCNAIAKSNSFSASAQLDESSARVTGINFSDDTNVTSLPAKALSYFQSAAALNRLQRHIAETQIILLGKMEPHVAIDSTVSTLSEKSEFTIMVNSLLETIHQDTTDKCKMQLDSKSVATVAKLGQTEKKEKGNSLQQFFKGSINDYSSLTATHINELTTTITQLYGQNSNPMRDYKALEKMSMEIAEIQINLPSFYVDINTIKEYDTLDRRDFSRQMDFLSSKKDYLVGNWGNEAHINNILTFDLNVSNPAKDAVIMKSIAIVKASLEQSLATETNESKREDISNCIAALTTIVTKKNNIVSNENYLQRFEHTGNAEDAKKYICCALKLDNTVNDNISGTLADASNQATLKNFSKRGANELENKSSPPLSKESIDYIVKKTDDYDRMAPTILKEFCTEKSHSDVWKLWDRVDPVSQKTKADDISRFLATSIPLKSMFTLDDDDLHEKVKEIFNKYLDGENIMKYSTGAEVLKCAIDKLGTLKASSITLERLTMEIKQALLAKAYIADPERIERIMTEAQNQPNNHVPIQLAVRKLNDHGIETVNPETSTDEKVTQSLDTRLKIVASKETTTIIARKLEQTIANVAKEDHSQSTTARLMNKLNSSVEVPTPAIQQLPAGNNNNLTAHAHSTAPVSLPPLPDKSEINRDEVKVSDSSKVKKVTIINPDQGTHQGTLPSWTKKTIVVEASTQKADGKDAPSEPESKSSVRSHP